MIKFMINKKLLSFFLFFLLFGNIYSLSGLTKESYSQILEGEPYDGFTLFSPEYSKKTYLIDMNGNIAHIWESDYIQGLPVYLLENGNLIRGCSKFDSPVSVIGGVTGHIEILEWNGSVVWEFDYSTNEYSLHHDIEVLSNGNILMIATEYKSKSEAIEAGRNPNYFRGNSLYFDYIIEVEPTGENSGNIIWEWHVWDHLIQDYSYLKNNFGVIFDHPELININPNALHFDLCHLNSIDYNEKYDQILLSAKNYNEIWIIDHSTTTEEASDHSGGKYGKGGDILYRWGNPLAYNRGGSEDQKLFSQHDAQWIEIGYPGEDNILIFNNGVRLEDTYSSVDEIIPPADGFGNYNIAFDAAFEPAEPIWTFVATPPSSFFSIKLSGADRLPNGNTIICSGGDGYFFEVTSENEIVWDYTNIFPDDTFNQVFNIHRYSEEYSGLLDLSTTRPNKPSIPNGVTEGDIDIEYIYSISATDPNNDNIKYGWDWNGDDIIDEWTKEYYPSGDTISISHFWSKAGIYKIKVIAMDINMTQSSFSPELTVNITGLSNNPPDKPNTPSGSTRGKVGEEYTYSSLTNDPEDDQIYYQWDWGDEISEWYGPYNSGETIYINHSWNNKGNYNVKVKAKDINGLEGSWSDSFSISMPKRYVYLFSDFFIRINKCITNLVFFMNQINYF